MLKIKIEFYSYSSFIQCTCSLSGRIKLGNIKNLPVSIIDTVVRNMLKQCTHTPINAATFFETVHRSVWASRGVPIISARGLVFFRLHGLTNHHSGQEEVRPILMSLFLNAEI